MTVASILIQDAMYAAQVIGQDQTPSSGDEQLVLRRLNRMLKSWANEGLMVYGITIDTFTMTAGTAQYSTSLLTDGRPVFISSMRVRLNNIDYPVDMIDLQKWNAIGYKLTQAIPNQCYYQPTYPNGLMNFYPVPYAAFTCYVDCQRPLVGDVELTTDILLPDGYEAAIVAALAVDIWPSFKGSKQPVPQDLKDDRTRTRGVIKRVNFEPLEMVNPIGGQPFADVSNGFLYKGF